MEIVAPRRWGLSLRAIPWRWALAAAGVSLALALPVLLVPLRALGPAGSAWSTLWMTLPGYLGNTLYLCLAAGLIAAVVGAGTAWLVAICTFPGRRFFRWALAMPLAVPAYIAAYAYAGMVDVTGPIQRAIRAWVPGMADTLFYWNVMRIEMVALILGMVLYPYVFLTVRTFLETRMGRPLEAARLGGMGPSKIFWRIGLPLSRPALAGGLALVLMEVLNDYGAVRYYGVTTLTTGIFRSWFSLGDLDTAVQLSAILMLAAFLVLLLERWQRGGARYSPPGVGQPVEAYTLRGLRGVAAMLCCAVPLLIGFALPVAQLLYWGVESAPRVVDAGFISLAANSVGLAAVAGVAAVAVALLLAYAARLDPTPATRAVARVAILGYSVPGAVIAVGLLLVVLGVDRLLTGGVSLVVAGTLGALLVAYVVRFLAVAYLPVEAGFERIGARTLDASRTLGASPLRALWRIELPLMRTTLAAAATLVMIDVMKELPLTLILRPFNFDTLATHAYQLATDEQVAESAPAALLVILGGVAVVTLLHRLVGKDLRT